MAVSPIRLIFSGISCITILAALLILGTCVKPVWLSFLSVDMQFGVYPTALNTISILTDIGLVIIGAITVFYMVFTAFSTHENPYIDEIGRI